MGEVSEDIELDLGLSIGGSFKKSENENSHAPPGEAVDPQGKREIHALRRQEAKRKRGQSRARNGGSPVSGDDDEKGEEVELKKNRVESNGSVKLDSNHNNGVSGSEQMGYASSSSPYPVMFPYPPIQYVPLSNGFAIPYVMPCWAPPNGAAAGGGGNEKQGVGQAVACRSFVPFQANLNSGVSVQNVWESEQTGTGGNRKATSNGSNLSSSVVSDNRSSSNEGGETRNNSSHSLPEQPQIEQSPAPSKPSSNPSGPDGEANASMHTNKPSASTPEPQVQANTKPTSTKPPKPQTQTHPLPKMPCVSATGNGPDGKTVTGILHRYTTNEVSIVCVCHGSSFSPAEFVAHAGGTDVTNPLKHITVIPSASG